MPKRQHLDGGLPKLVHRKIDTRVLADQRESRQIVVTLGKMFYQEQKAAQWFYATFDSKSGRDVSYE